MRAISLIHAAWSKRRGCPARPSSPTQPKRRGMYAAMQRIMRDESGVVVPMFGADLPAAGDKLG